MLVIIIKPASVTASTLTSSNVAETDYPNWAAGTYVVGDRVIYDHRIWEVVAASTTDVPDAGAAAVPATWLFVSATNRYKMFDISVGSGTVNSGSINITITPATVANAVVLFDVDGSSAQLIVRDSGSTIVYDETVSLADYSGLNSYFNYYFLPIVETGATELAFIDIPNYSGASFQLIIDAGAGDASCGELIIGQKSNLAVTNFGTSVGIKDYSVKNIDDFGNITITTRAYSKRADYDVTVETAQVGQFNKFLASIRSTPVVYIGDPDRSETIVLGYYRDFSVVLSNPSISECSLSVEGLT
tara:strand:+ start:1428 stop:2333 length:906 start_codon:yes stop_codon:yes gene_type:complete